MIGSPSDVEEELAGAGDWDDTELIKQWEVAEKALKQGLPQKAVSSQQIESASKKNKKKTKQKSKSPSSDIPEKTETSHPRPQEPGPHLATQEPGKWAVGDVCMAYYSEDSLWYEATVIGVDSHRDTCVVEYSGYENDEADQQPLSDILTVDEFNKSTERHTTNAAAEAEKGRRDEAQPVGDDAMIPPPPPYIPIEGQPMVAGDGAGDVVTRKMLISWYMAGYYAGFYKGLQAGKSKSKSDAEA